MHNRRCVVSGEATQEVLEAAHVLCFARYPKQRDDPRNGVALRADIHRLFDIGLLSIDRDKLVLSEKLRGSGYEVFRNVLISTSAYPAFLAQHHHDAL
jgi:predicted restriction endonuclease